MAKKVAGHKLQFEQDLGAGGQGHAEKMLLTDGSNLPVVMKTFAHSDIAEKRTRQLVDFNLPALSPYLAAPIVMDVHKKNIRHIAPYAPGEMLEDDRQRTFAENLELAHLFECQATILEENNIWFGDYSGNNLKITDDGAVHLFDFDNYGCDRTSVPLSTMIGQAMMLAPELRAGGIAPTMESDRFARATLQNMILLGRYPADGLAVNPAERNAVMSNGTWPERVRTPEPNETPICALGTDLQMLFDQAYDLAPHLRPSADAWRRTLSRGLRNLYIHTCGQAFIGDQGQSQCPWCNQPITIQDTSLVLRIEIKGSHARYKIKLQDDVPIVVGRGNLGGLPQTVSTRHLEICRSGNSIRFHNLGQNGTKIWYQGVWNPITFNQLSLLAINGPLHFKLADCDLSIQLGTAKEI